MCSILAQLAAASRCIQFTMEAGPGQRERWLLLLLQPEEVEQNCNAIKGKTLVLRHAPPIARSRRQVSLILAYRRSKSPSLRPQRRHCSMDRTDGRRRTPKRENNLKRLRKTTVRSTAAPATTTASPMTRLSARRRRFGLSHDDTVAYRGAKPPDFCFPTLASDVGLPDGVAGSDAEFRSAVGIVSTHTLDEAGHRW
ncbi:unnamed protein product [Soboliphyme baturini]|uniref:Uncharacterized protein n=1 Tax=Soboliphyme baturini TaxID=241478 RepID=A0A183IV03_9BILA|nr:unnamed protein product [Soboliphyme baturini]